MGSKQLIKHINFNFCSPLSVCSVVKFPLPREFLVWELCLQHNFQTLEYSPKQSTTITTTNPRWASDFTIIKHAFINCRCSVHFSQNCQLRKCKTYVILIRVNAKSAYSSSHMRKGQFLSRALDSSGSLSLKKFIPLCCLLFLF